MIVAEQVAAALEGGLVTNAVNIPVDRRGRPRGARAVHPARGEARRGSRWSWPRGAPSRSTLTYYGALADYDTRLLTVAALNGAFQGRVEQPVNYVNAPLVAAELGIEVREERRRDSPRLHEPRPRRGRARRRGGPRRRDDDRPREPALARERARLRARDGARAADGLLPLRRRPGRDRARRHALRRRGREHREHGRLAHAHGRQGADGALDRHARRRPSSSSASARRASTTPASSRWPRRVRVGDVHLYFDTAGWVSSPTARDARAPEIVCLHGGRASTTHALALPRAARRARAVVFLDRRGLGRSDECSPDRWASPLDRGPPRVLRGARDRAACPARPVVRRAGRPRHALRHPICRASCRLEQRRGSGSTARCRSSSGSAGMRRAMPSGSSDPTRRTSTRSPLPAALQPAG